MSNLVRVTSFEVRMADISFFNQAKLLIVDDEQVNLILLERILRDCGFQNMLTAQSAEEA